MKTLSHFAFKPALLTLFALLIAAAAAAAEKPVPKKYDYNRFKTGRRPNVLLVMTDDQGYGDLGCHGNKIIKTFALDKLHAEGIRLTNFHTDPTCSPTRAALLTGRYSERTGVWHTIMGRSILRRDEKTAADIFAAAGYRTGIFGKWHLGDNYPYRAMDRGFQESLVHGGGGIGQTPDYWGNKYSDPVLYHNGKWEKYKGYCTDIFFAAAMKFIEAHQKEPFFVYLPTNVPHSPLQVPEEYSRPYLDAGLRGGLAAFYGMITNFDQNFGRLMTKLEALGLAENTIVIFMTDNGSAGGGYGAGMRGKKGDVYEGGHRVPCFIRWPAQLQGGYDVPQLTAHVDILPTLLELCNIPEPQGIKLDGTGLLPLLVRLEDWGPRTLFVQSHRIDQPQLWRNSAVMFEDVVVVNRPGEYTERRELRLIDGRDLYDIKKDPGQMTNIAGESKTTVAKLRFKYEEWYKDVSKRFGEYCEIVIGSPKQNPTELNCMDWHGTIVPWDQPMIVERMPGNGFWAIEVERAGRYQFTLRERPAVAKHPLHPGVARLKVGDKTLTKAIPAAATAVTFDLDLKPGKTQVQTWLIDQDAPPAAGVRGAYFVEVLYVEK